MASQQPAVQPTMILQRPPGSGNNAPSNSQPQQQRPPPPQQQQQQQQQQQRGGSGRGRGRGVRGGGRGGGRGNAQQQQIPYSNNARQGRGIGGGRGPGVSGPIPVSIAPTTGIPFGHVPAYLPGSSSLVEELNQRLLIVLRDGRHLVGTLRSFDQYSNMVLDDASERKIHINPTDKITYFADIPLGLYIVRGDSMVLLGQVGMDDERHMTKVDLIELDDMMTKAKQNTEQDAEPELEWDFDKDLLA